MLIDRKSLFGMEAVTFVDVHSVVARRTSQKNNSELGELAKED